jgi:hypothetical protein
LEIGVSVIALADEEPVVPGTEEVPGEAERVGRESGSVWGLLEPVLKPESASAVAPFAELYGAVDHPVDPPVYPVPPP